MDLSLNAAFGKVTQLKEELYERHLSQVFMFDFSMLFFDIIVETYKPENVILYANNLSCAKLYPKASLSGG